VIAVGIFRLFWGMIVLKLNNSRLRFAVAAIGLCIVVIFTYLGSHINVQADGETIANLQREADNINSRLAELDQQRRQIEANIGSARTEIERERQIQMYLDQQIAITREEIELLEEAIENLRQEIEIKENDITEKQQEHDENFELFRQRLRAMYMFGDASTLGLLLGADSLADFLSRADTITRVAQHDRDLMQRLTNDRIELEAQHTELERRREAEEELHKTTEQKRDVLTRQSQEAAIRIQDISSMQAQFEADLAQTQAMRNTMERELQDVFRRIQWAQNPFVGGEMRWPVDGFTNISSHYGWRFNGRDFHTGIDIAGRGIYGQPVRAANSGTVVVANWSFTPGRGYGMFVIIDHGGRISTLYAHLSNITVSVGDWVEVGQQIGNVGSTGWSTGPHLHFEYREGGNHRDPLTVLRPR